ncbi:hypothetical protein MNBD_GAMMA03-2022 [hydrothermal vent metagenome]|uniref:Endonuclease GajA/Old nuclease/RecF-like AAA domain-containing protein n=1 Tax=hydrothermal vent metagenome TaxID=652676 RepID=A0A3B0VYX2_9ZZZZ
MKLSGIEIKNFRSIGEEAIVLRPWSKCNILVGQNNSGKSTVIRALQKIMGLHSDKIKDSLTELDFHDRDSSNTFEYKLYWMIEDSDPDNVKEIADIIGTNELYFCIEVHANSSLKYVDWSGKDVKKFEDANRLMSLIARETWMRQVPESIIENKMKELTQGAFGLFKSSIPTVHIIPEFRQIRPGDNYHFDGKNLVDLLGGYQIPSIGQDSDQEKFKLIQKFVQNLLHLPTAVLQVTRENELIITNQDLRLPLSSFGTGTHELIIMLTAVLANQGDLYCIEEPEVHLHPRLQRDFVNFLIKHTGNSYILSTHSQVFVNSTEWVSDIQVFHLKNIGGVTCSNALINDSAVIQALTDLGVKPSDLLLTNCTIWVEGPTDRIYIKRWLELVAPELIAERDYSIMFYGGMLLSHLSFERDSTKKISLENIDKVPEELIPILRINQNAIVVMDSDRKGPRGRIRRTKERVKYECEKNDGYCWVTEGKEIENLLPRTAINRSLTKLQGKTIEFECGKYDSFPKKLFQATSTGKLKPVRYENNKVKYSRIFAQETNLDDIEPELLKTLKELVTRIKFWNDLPSD